MLSHSWRVEAMVVRQGGDARFTLRASCVRRVGVHLTVGVTRSVRSVVREMCYVPSPQLHIRQHLSLQPPFEPHAPLSHLRPLQRALIFFSSRRRHTRYWRDWSSDVCSSDLCALWFRRAPASNRFGTGREHNGPCQRAGPTDDPRNASRLPTA